MSHWKKVIAEMRPDGAAVADERLRIIRNPPLVGDRIERDHAPLRILNFHQLVTRPRSVRLPGHEEDFINCIRTRQKPIMTIEAGHAVAALCILGNISYILGRKLQWDGAQERVMGDEEANRMLSRPNRSPWHI